MRLFFQKSIYLGGSALRPHPLAAFAKQDPTNMPTTIERCLAKLGLALASLAGCDDLDAEWSAVKRASMSNMRRLSWYSRGCVRRQSMPQAAPSSDQPRPISRSRGSQPSRSFFRHRRAYFKTALKTHPDKGGDAAAFRKVQGAFEALRKAYDRGCADPSSGFLFSASAAQSAERELPAGPESSIPSWEFYAEAAEEVAPMYRVERAKSGRSRCQAKGSAQSPQCSRDDLIAKDELRVGWLNSETGSYGGWVHVGCSNPNS